jgi:hypothetical protein
MGIPPEGLVTVRLHLSCCDQCIVESELPTLFPHHDHCFHELDATFGVATRCSRARVYERPRPLHHCYELRTFSRMAPKPQLWTAITICDNGWSLRHDMGTMASPYRVTGPRFLPPSSAYVLTNYPIPNSRCYLVDMSLIND